MANRKPHNDFVGYRCERRNPISGGHTIILDCKQGLLVDNYKVAGRYQVLCNEHSMIVHCSSMPEARICMKDATAFCGVCRDLAGESDGTVLSSYVVYGSYLAKGGA